MINETKILLIEDDPALRDLIRLVLECQPGYKVLIARDGEQALQIIETEQPRVLLFDILLPRLNGFDLLRYLSQQNLLKCCAPVIISSFGYPEIIQQAIANGACDFIVKPFDSDELVTRVNRIVKNLAPQIISNYDVSAPVKSTAQAAKSPVRIQPLGTNPRVLPHSANSLPRFQPPSAGC